MANKVSEENRTNITFANFDVSKNEVNINSLNLFSSLKPQKNEKQSNITNIKNLGCFIFGCHVQNEFYKINLHLIT